MTTKEIRKIVEVEFGCDISIITRKRKYIRARWVYYYLCRQYTDQSLMAVGGELISEGKPNGFDHATVLWGVRQMEADLKLKQFEYPQEFRNILSVFVVRSGSLLEDMVGGDDRIKLLQESFHQELNTIMDRFTKEIQELRKVCANDIIDKIKKEILQLDAGANRVIPETEKTELV